MPLVPGVRLGVYEVVGLLGAENTFLGPALGGAGGSPAANGGTVSPDRTRLVFVATDPSGKTFL